MAMAPGESAMQRPAPSSSSKMSSAKLVRNRSKDSDVTPRTPGGRLLPQYEMSPRSRNASGRNTNAKKDESSDNNENRTTRAGHQLPQYSNSPKSPADSASPLPYGISPFGRGSTKSFGRMGTGLSLGKAYDPTSFECNLTPTGTPTSKMPFPGAHFENSPA